MALVTTNVTPELRITPFVGLTELRREQSGIARSEMVAFSNGSWPATGAGDNRGLIFSFNLDRSYGHILMDISCAFLGASNSTLKVEANSVLELAIPSGSTGTEYVYESLFSPPGRQDSSGGTAIGSVSAANYNTLYPTGTDTGSMVFTLQRRPTYMLYPYSGTAPARQCSVTAIFGEQSTEEPTLSYRFAARLLQYDITQGYNYRVNSPIMTR
jgi:hypothetical protein